jgi:hypothetical protein
MTTPLANSLRDALIQRAWAQWVALGVDAVGAAESSVVDPEALIALTAEIGEADARLRDTSTDWCVAYGRFVNGTRLRQVVAEIGTPESAIGEYAATVAGAGGPSWRQGRAREGYRYRGTARLEDLGDLPRLLLRLRAIYGVNARADVIGYLLARPDPTVSLADLARSTRFTKRNVALTVDALALGGVVTVERVGNQQRVRLEPEMAHGWLPVPIQRIDWVDRYTVGLNALRFLNRSDRMADAVRAIEAKVVSERLMPLLRRERLPAPDGRVRGEAFSTAFDRCVARLTMRLAVEPSERQKLLAIAAFFELDSEGPEMVRLTGLRVTTLRSVLRQPRKQLCAPAHDHLDVLSSFTDEAAGFLSRMTGWDYPAGSRSVRDWLTDGTIRTKRGRSRPIEALSNPALAILALEDLRRAAH